MTPDVFRTTIDKQGRVTIPKKLRDAAGIKPGDTVEIRPLGPGWVVVEKAKTAPSG